MTEVKVYTAISELTDELRQHGIEKAKKSQGGQFNYAYRGIEDVYAALAPLLPKHHIVIAPVRIEKKPDSTAGKMRLVRIKVSYQITSMEDGSHFCVESLGEGADIGDKAAGKVMSYAYKSLMFQLFCIPVAGISDSDKQQSRGRKKRARSLTTILLTGTASGKEAWVEFWKSCSKDEREALRTSSEVDLAKKIIEAMQGGLP